ncbi:DUF365 domain-containing protein [Methanospirillum purgamenti]|uniref:DUF365 domain-containing protein n=1 Tax=Methanospirillum hungatei TaxID=2203 RepID=A0A8F5VRC9_METHU|nr:DUF365 domain-containing protein [Methanospirillum hungatei]QXO96033.1 DUF365 domain-containing protein [Methanospirillum hungatei]
MTEIIGVTFPIPKSYMGRFFKGKTVFIKPATCFKEIQPGMKLVFYQSREDTGFVGEGVIAEIAFDENPLNFFTRFGNKIFLSSDEVNQYLEYQDHWKSTRRRKGNVKKKPWMALVLKDIKQYSNIEKPERFVPVGGQYIRK